jgi:hypothetical protein
MHNSPSRRPAPSHPGAGIRPRSAQAKAGQRQQQEETMLNLKIIIGSTRPGRVADHVMRWITGLAKQHPAFTVEVLDLRDWPLPFFAETVQTVGDPRDPSYSDPLVKRRCAAPC